MQTHISNPLGKTKPCAGPMRPNKAEAAVQWFCVSRAVPAGFSGHCDLISNIIPLVKKEKKFFFSSLAKCWFLTLFSFSLIITLWSAGTTKFTIRQVLFCY